MPNSSALNPGDDLLSAQFNALRDDVLDLVSGHDHSGAAEHGKGVHHGATTGLGDDDHPQYPGHAQVETISGAWTFTGLMRVPSGTEFPGAPVDGDVFYRTDEDLLYIYDGAAWEGIAPAAHDILSASHGDTLAAGVVDGDVMIGNITPKWSRLAIVVPAANVRNVLGIDAAEPRPSWKTALDATDPVDIAAAAAPGTSLLFSHLDHKHKHPAGLGVNLHHTQAHDIVGGDHAITGAKWHVVGCIAIDTVGLFLALADVSAGAGVEAILKSNATGGLILQRLDTDTMGLPSGNAFPGAPADGDIYYRTDEDIVYVYDGAAWAVISGAAGDHPLDPLATGGVHTGTLPGLHAHADNENKSGECNGVKTVFLTAQEFSQESLHVFLNGQLLTPDDDYAEGAFYDSFAMSVAPIAGDKLMLSYVAEWA